jgi:AraC-like DNA-binding protein
MENRFLQFLRDGLESGSILSPGIQAKIVAIESSFEVADHHIQVDAIVEFTIKDLPNKSIRAVIEMKSRLTPMVLEGAIHQVLGYRNELRRSGAFDNLYPMVAAPYISDSVQRRCKELGVGYIDLNGTLALIHDDVYVDVVRPATRFKNPQGAKNIFSGRSRRIIRVLLANPHRPYRLEELASEAQLSTGQVFQVTKRLQEDGLLDRTPEGRVLTKPRKLLRLFAQGLKTDYAQNRTVFSAFSETPPTQFAQFLRETCERKGIQHAFTLTSGLEPSERNAREEITAAYINVPPESLRNGLQLEAVGKGANVLLMMPPDSDNTDAGGVFYRPRKLTNGLTGVNPVQLYADFTLHGSRGDEQAEFLIEHALGFRE